jgi:tRNA (cytidine/uridine-2'-O-)-methyltransferase
MAAAPETRPALALFQPDIPQNAGAILRTAACFGIEVHLIYPAGFALSDRGLRRAGLDYAARATLREHDDWTAFEARRREAGRRLVALTSHGETELTGFAFRPDDVLLMGRESAGLPEPVLMGAAARLRIPIRAGTRSLNVSVAAGIALFEALRQTGGLPLAGAGGT